jgi:hypothetical protein
MLKRKANPEITFIAEHDGMLGDKLIQPRSASAYIPDWWRQIPQTINRIKWFDNNPIEISTPTAKQCPSFAHWFGQGYVLPTWCDIKIKHDPETNVYTWNAGRDGSPYTIDIHDGDQLLNHADLTYFGRKPSLVFKLISPWYAVTPKGWSIYQFPMFYHNTQDWVVLPGVIDTDTGHELNQQILYFGNGKDIFIPKGTPLVQYIPFKREKLKLKIEKKTKKNNLVIKTSQLKISSKLHKGYLDIKKEADKRN